VPEHPNATDADPRDHPTASTLAAFLDGELAPEERARVEAHLERCTACRRELADTVEVLGAAPAGPSVARVPVATRRRSRTSMLAIGAALAASIAGAAVLWRPPESTVPVETRTRDAGPSALDERTPRLAAVAPANGAERTSLRPDFVWRSAAANRYSFRLLTDDGTLVWSSETADTTVALPEDVRLERGRSYFWRVDALAAGIGASTHAQRFTVSP
jgi:hypothetical protein